MAITIREDAEAAGRQDAPSRRWSVTRILVLVIVTLPVSAALWQMVRDQWLPTGDAALLEMQARNLADHIPLLGSYSRFGWYHPGPAFIWYEALGYYLTGARSGGLMLATAVLHLAMLVLGWLTVRRISVVAGGLMVVISLVSLLVTLAEHTLEPWNPYAATVGIITFLGCAWGTAQRQRLSVALILPLGAFLSQAHVGALPVVVLVTLAAFLLSWRPKGEDPPFPGRALLVGVVAFALLWLPPLVQTVLDPPGNLAQLLGQAASHGATVNPLGPFTGAYGMPPYWTDGNNIWLPVGLSVPVLLAPLVIATGVCGFLRDRTRIRLLVICWVAVVAALVALSGIQGMPATYLVAWMPGVVLFTAVLPLWAVVSALWPEVEASPAAPVAVLGLGVLLSAGLSVQWVISDGPKGMGVDVSRDAAAAVAADSGGAPIDLRSEDRGLFFGFVFYGALLDLSRNGQPVTVGSVERWQSGGSLPQRTDNRPVYTLQNFDRGDPVPPGSRVVYTYDPFTEEEWDQILVANARLADPALDSGARAWFQMGRAQIMQGEEALRILRSDAPLQLESDSEASGRDGTAGWIARCWRGSLDPTRADPTKPGGGDECASGPGEPWFGTSGGSAP